MKQKQQNQPQAGSPERPLFPTPINRQQVITDKKGRGQVFEIHGIIGGKLDDTDVAAVYKGPADGKHQVLGKKQAEMERRALQAAGFDRAAALSREEIGKRATDPETQAQREQLLKAAQEEAATFRALEPARQREIAAAPKRDQVVRDMVIQPGAKKDEVAEDLITLGYQDYGRAPQYPLGWDRLLTTLFLSPSKDMKRLLGTLSKEEISRLGMLEIQDGLRATVQQVFPEFHNPAIAIAKKITKIMQFKPLALVLSPLPWIDGVGDTIDLAANIIEGKRVRRLLADGTIAAVDYSPIPSLGLNLGIAGGDFDTADSVYAGGLMYLLEDGLRNPNSPHANHRGEFAQAILGARPLEGYFNEYLEAAGVKQRGRDRINKVFDKLRKGILFGKLKFDFRPLQQGEQIPEFLRPYADRINTQQVIDEFNTYLLAHKDSTLQNDEQLRVLHVRYRIARLIEDARALSQKQLPEPENTVDSTE